MPSPNPCAALVNFQAGTLLIIPNRWAPQGSQHSNLWYCLVYISENQLVKVFTWTADGFQSFSKSKLFFPFFFLSPSSKKEITLPPAPPFLPRRSKKTANPTGEKLKFLKLSPAILNLDPGLGEARLREISTQLFFSVITPGFFPKENSKTISHFLFFISNFISGLSVKR